MIALAEQCLADYDENGWRDPAWHDPAWRDPAWLDPGEVALAARNGEGRGET